MADNAAHPSKACEREVREQLGAVLAEIDKAHDTIATYRRLADRAEAGAVRKLAESLVVQEEAKLTNLKASGLTLTCSLAVMALADLVPSIKTMHAQLEGARQLLYFFV
ncbi:hypothetical protein ACVWZM_001567 [Bradyrhizobium sp. USDA 4501]